MRIRQTYLVFLLLAFLALPGCTNDEGDDSLETLTPTETEE